MNIKKYLPSIISIGIVIIVCIATCLFIVLTGITARGTNYVLMEINPKIEFLTNGRNKVTSVKGLNNEAKELMIGEEFVGLDISDACIKFADICARTGYIDVDGDNAINLTILDGLTQATNVHIIEHLTKALKKQEIKTVIMESTDDVALFKKCKKTGVNNANRLKTMMTILDYDNDENYTLNDLKSKKEASLIKIIQKNHENSENKTSLTGTLKQELINKNAEKYNAHMEKINNKTQREYANIYKKFLSEKQKGYMLDFDTAYNTYND